MSRVAEIALAIRDDGTHTQGHDPRHDARDWNRQPSMRKPDYTSRPASQ